MELNNESFARIFWAHVMEMPQHRGFDLQRIVYSLRFSIRIWSEKPHSMISRKVAEYFIGNYAQTNPFEVRWKDRKKYGVLENKKSLLVLEHTTPVSVLSSALSRAKSLEEVQELVNSYSGVCMVTRDEDDLLTSKGYLKRRPAGWQAAYADCEIEVLDRQAYSELLANHRS